MNIGHFLFDSILEKPFYRSVGGYLMFNVQLTYFTIESCTFVTFSMRIRHMEKQQMTLKKSLYLPNLIFHVDHMFGSD